VTTRLEGLVDRLQNTHGPQKPPPARDPFRLLLWEQVGYLADDEKRRAAYEFLEASVGTSPDEILNAPLKDLRAVTMAGGSIAAGPRAERLRDVAARVATVWKGDVQYVLGLAFLAARKELAQFPSIGEAGAERILLLSGGHPTLALESNALRVLLRLGYGQDSPNWVKAYRSAQAAAEPEVRATVPARRRAYLLLRRHGQTMCRRSDPICHACPLRPDCPHGARASS
jgi:endonuclease-3 related protein